MIYLLIFAHWVADFVCQTDGMAKGKSSSNMWLGKHIATYTIVLFAIMVLANPLAGAFIFSLMNGIVHFATDYVTSRITKRLYTKGDIHNFFVVIGLDQAIHMTTLIITLPLLEIQ